MILKRTFIEKKDDEIKSDRKMEDRQQKNEEKLIEI